MAATSSFDVISDFDRQELVNAVDQLKREIAQRYDLKDTNTEIKLEETCIIITTESDMTLKAVEDVLRQKAVKRNLSLKIFEFQPSENAGGNRVLQKVLLRKGIPQEVAKKLSKDLRNEFKKINVSIQGDSLRIIGKNKDELQSAISFLRSKEEELDIPLQFDNYR